MLVPKWRFPEFREAGAWEETSIKQIGTVIRGASPRPKGDPRYYGGSIPRLMVEDVTRDGKYVKPRIDFLTEEGAKLSRPCKKGTLTIVCSGTVGIPSILAVDACIHDGFLAIIDLKKNISIEFLYQKISTLKEKFQSSATHGGVFTNLTTDILKEFIIEIPSFPEQQKIATLLTTLDHLIAAQNEKISALQRHKKGLMQQLFPAEGERVPRVRFEGFEGSGEWEELSIGKKVDLLSGYPFNSSEISEDSSGTPLLRGINITEGYIRHSREIDRFYIGSTRNLEKFKVATDDLVIGMDGSKVGKNSALISENDSGSLLIQRVARLRSSCRTTIQFIFQQINSIKFHAYVDRINTSSGIPHISANQILEFKICFPSIAEQQKIATLLTTLDDLIAAQIQKREALKRQKKGLMQGVFPNPEGVSYDTDGASLLKN